MNATTGNSEGWPSARPHTKLKHGDGKQTGADIRSPRITASSTGFTPGLEGVN